MKITRWDVLVAVALAGIYCYLAFRTVLPSNFSKPIRSAKIDVDIPLHSDDEYVLTDPDLLRQALSEPLQNATLDRSGALWMCLGTLELEHTDGTTSAMSLYLPWGQISCGRYYTVDFALLRETMEKEYRGSQESKDIIFAEY